MKIQRRLTLGIGILFAMIVLLGIQSVGYVRQLSRATGTSLADNYNSLQYAGEMLRSLNDIGQDSISRHALRENLALQQQNITEISEKETTAALERHVASLSDPVTEAEIRSIIQEGAEDGEVQEVEQQIVGRVFSLGDRTVESIMTHRSEIAWIDVAMSVDEINRIVAEAPHNRYPVGDGSLDKLLGVVYLKDLFLHLNEPGFDIRKILTPGKFFHEEFEVYNALEQLRSEQLGYGIICDEFGVTRGIITLKDIFEALVGELPDPREEPDIVRRDDGSSLIDGQCPFYDFLAAYGIEDDIPSNAYNTLSGLILDLLGHIPSTGEKVEWRGFTFEIVDMDGARIDKILVVYHKPTTEEEA